jgi:hypothetical protein
MSSVAVSWSLTVLGCVVVVDGLGYGFNDFVVLIDLRAVRREFEFLVPFGLFPIETHDITREAHSPALLRVHPSIMDNTHPSFFEEQSRVAHNGTIFLPV